MAEAQGTYLTTLLRALGGNYTSLRDYLMISGGTFREIAKIKAEAITDCSRILAFGPPTAPAPALELPE